MRRPSGLAILLASALCFPFHDARAQGEDAVPLRAGTLRVNVLPDWARWNERFGRGTPGYSEGSREPLAVDFSSDSLGVTQLPALVNVQQRIADYTGIAGFRLNLGRGVLTLNNSVRVVPIGVDFALTSRLVLRATMPIVRARVEAFLAGSDTTAASKGNVGINPALRSPTTYDPFVTQVDTLLRALQYQAQNGPASLQAQAAAAYTSLSASLCELYTLAAGYGGACTLGQVDGTQSPVLPVAGSAAAESLATRLTADRTSYENLRTQYAAQGVTLPAFDAGYQLPATALDSADLRTVLLRHYQGDSLTTMVRTRLGNVELGAWYQLAMGPRWRSQLAFTLRLPTAVDDSPNYFADLGTGVAATGYEAALRNDIVLRRDFWVHAGARVSGWSSYDLVRRVAPANVFLVPLADTATVRRSPGLTTAIDLVPNWQLDDAFRLGMGIHWVHVAASAHAYVNAADQARIGLPASVLDEETAMTALRLGAGMTFSTLDRYYRGRASLPYTVTLSYNRVFRGSGGKVPAASSFALLVRGYVPVWGN